MKNIFVLLIGVVVLTLVACNTPAPPAPYGPVPTSQLLEWQKMEYYMFIHFGPNTFTDKEWGHGDEDPKVFNPSALDCRQWARIAKDAGMKAIIITAKHHDGFCLWPSNYSTHTVRESAWKDGKGDILRELSEACKEYGLKFGVYLSPWDRNHPTYGTDEYNQVFANTLTEVLSGYGPVFEQWFDGACGEGPNGKVQVYDWKLFLGVVKKFQPDAIIFGSPYWTVRWVGNERGYADETNWSTFDSEAYFKTEDLSVLERGIENGKEWLPAEVDVSIRPGWFYSPATDDKVKSLSKMLGIYYTSVGRNGNLLLNVPPDRRGLIHPNDSARLMELRKALDAGFAVNLAKDAEIKASNVRGNVSAYGVQNLTDGKYDTYWATGDGQLTASIEIDLKKEQSVNRLVLQEYIPLGQRIKAFGVEYFDGTEWYPIDRQTTVGYKRILCFPSVTAKKIRINIEESLACPILNEIGLYKAEEMLSLPVILRDKKGNVTIRCESDDPIIRYTTDGSEPTANSTRYVKSFNMSAGGIVKAKAFVNGETQSSETVTINYDIATEKWKVLSGNPKTGQENAIDEDPQTNYSFTDVSNIVVDLGEKLTVKGFFYLPLPHARNNVYKYDFYTSLDGKKWQKMKSGAFANIKNNPVRHDVLFDRPTEVRYFKMDILETADPKDSGATIAEIGVLTR